jgi:hypothetical protein
VEGTNRNGNWALDASASAVTPIPAALPLFATGLGVMGLLGWRRKRKATAAAAFSAGGDAGKSRRPMQNVI